MSNRPAVTAILLLLPLIAFNGASAQDSGSKMGPLARKAASRADVAQVILRTTQPESIGDVIPAIERAGGRIGRRLPIINGIVISVPGNALEGLANNPLVEEVSLDRPAYATMERTGATIGSTAIRRQLGYDGTGVGVAVIDSGITSWHDDLDGSSSRVNTFVDFVNGRQTRYDDYGHGTHVAGIIAGTGVDSNGARTGIAPGANLIVLKVLNGSGAGRISDVIAAMDYVRNNRTALNIRVVNLSVGTGVYESYRKDPLTIATKRLVEAGIVVVVAAGNAGKDPNGVTRYGGVTSPGNAPWVLTVGASSHLGTVERTDDTVGAFSSRGPTAVDYTAKPDLVAPGVGIESLSDPLSAFYSTKSSYLLDGTVPTNYRPYLSLTGTSMASPVVAGTVALMIQANPSLTPNAVKAILQYTSQQYVGYDALTQGTGFLNADGAIRLARAFADPSVSLPTDSTWSRRIIWANHRVTGGTLSPSANAWDPSVTWGAVRAGGGALISWGNGWGASCADSLCSSLTWGAPSSPNVVWGARCGGDNCDEVWRRSTAGSQPIGASENDTVVWGNDADTVVWGNTDADTVVWGNSDTDTVVWGNSDGDTVVWGNSCVDSSCQPVIWGSSGN